MRSFPRGRRQKSRPRTTRRGKFKPPRSCSFNCFFFLFHRLSLIKWWKRRSNYPTNKLPQQDIAIKFTDPIFIFIFSPSLRLKSLSGASTAAVVADHKYALSAHPDHHMRSCSKSHHCLLFHTLLCAQTAQHWNQTHHFFPDKGKANRIEIRDKYFRHWCKNSHWKLSR